MPEISGTVSPHQSIKRVIAFSFMPVLAPDNPRLSFFTFHIIRNRVLCMSEYATGRQRLYFAPGFPLYLFRLSVRHALAGRWHAIAAIMRGLADAFSVLQGDRK